MTYDIYTHGQGFVWEQVQHPAAKMLVLASQQQEQECGDGTNFVLVFGGALLESAEALVRMVSVCQFM